MVSINNIMLSTNIIKEVDNLIIIISIALDTIN